MSEGGKILTFRLGENSFQRKLSLSALKNFSDDIQISIFSSSEFSYKSTDIDFEVFQQYIDFLIDLTPIDVNDQNIGQFIELSDKTGSTIIRNYFQKMLDKIGICRSFLLKLHDNKSEDHSMIEEKISTNLDKYICQCENELKDLNTTTLINIFYNNKRKLLNHDAAYEFIIKAGRSKNDPDIFTLLNSLDCTFMSEENINDALINQESHFGFLPKTSELFLKKLKEKTDKIELQFGRMNDQFKILIEKFDSFDKRISKIEQGIQKIKQNITLNIDEFDFLRRKNNENEKFFLGYCEKVLKTAQNINIALYGYNSTVMDDTIHFFNRPFLFNLKGIVRIIGVQSPLLSTQKEKILNIFNDGSSYCDNYLLAATEPVQTDPIEILNSEYIKSNDKNNDIINPTVRSKIIFGVSSIMKRLHKNNVLIMNLSGNVYLDENLEPIIKIPGSSYIINNKLKLKQIENSNGVYYSKQILSPEQIFDDDDAKISLSNDVFVFAFFVYSLFTQTKNEDEFITKVCKCRSFYQFARYINEGKRPEKIDLIPDNYWALINNCWKANPEERPSFEEITEILKSDEYAINEFGMQTDLDKLHEYQNRIESDE